MKGILAVLFVGLVFSTEMSAQTTQARKTITNADLECFRQERLKNDPDDENERRRLGLPSRAEQERMRTEEREKLSELANRIRQERAEKENYWLELALPLRSEILAVEAEINYVRARVNEIPSPQTYYAVGYSPYYGNCCFGGLSAGISQTNVRSIGFGASTSFGRRSQIVLQAGFGKTPRTQTGGIGTHAYHRRTPIKKITFGGIPYQRGILVVPFTLPTYENLTREDLLSRLRALEQTRAGLVARFRLVQDEASRDGVKID